MELVVEVRLVMGKIESIVCRESVTLYATSSTDQFGQSAMTAMTYGGAAD